MKISVTSWTRRAACLVAATVLCSLVSCKVLRPSVWVVKPEAMSSIESLAIWPAATVPLSDLANIRDCTLIDSRLAHSSEYRDWCEAYSAAMDTVLANELAATRLFQVTGSSQIVSAVSELNPYFTRFDRADWRTYKEQIDAETVVVTEMSIEWDYGGDHARFKLYLYDRKTGALLARSHSYTEDVKGHFSGSRLDQATVEAIGGAVVCLAKELRKHRALNPADSRD